MAAVWEAKGTGLGFRSSGEDEPQMRRISARAERVRAAGESRGTCFSSSYRMSGECAPNVSVCKYKPLSQGHAQVLLGWELALG